MRCCYYCTISWNWEQGGILTMWFIILIAALTAQVHGNGKFLELTSIVSTCIVYPAVIYLIKKTKASRRRTTSASTNSSIDVATHVEQIRQREQQGYCSTESEEEDEEVVRSENNDYIDLIDQVEIENINDERSQETEGLTNSDVVTISQQQAASSRNNRRRLYFLDNVKSFLTIIVVTHHVSCAFGGCGNGWYLVIGNYPCLFQRIIGCFTLLNQGYFMSLFFFISAYFTPISNNRKGTVEFHIDKIKRLTIPLIFLTLTICPLTIMIAVAYIFHQVVFIPNPGPGWFIIWLLIFNIAYSTVREAGNRNETQHNETPSQTPRPFPGTLSRCMYGIFICGILMGNILMIYKSDFGSFAFMPMVPGSLSCDILMFAVGITAQQNGWLDKPLRQQLDINIWCLRAGVILQSIGMIILLPVVANSPALGTFFIVLAGLYCLDMSLVVLDFFQQWFNFQHTPLTQFFANTAYTVYLIHPIVITPLTTLFISTYDHFIQHSGSIIEFPSTTTASSTVLAGPGNGSIVLALGWFIVLILTHLIVWPLAWYVRKLPGFKLVL